MLLVDGIPGLHCCLCIEANLQLHHHKFVACRHSSISCGNSGSRAPGLVGGRSSLLVFQHPLLKCRQLGAQGCLGSRWNGRAIDGLSSFVQDQTMNQRCTCQVSTY